MKRQEQDLIVRLWRDWCRIWPQDYGRESLDLKADGYDPSFDLIPAQTYKDFYFEVVRGHPKLRHLNAFEVVDVALNQTSAPETNFVRHAEGDSVATPQTLDLPEVEENDVDEVDIEAPAASIEPFIVEVELQPLIDPRDNDRQDIA